MFGRESITAVSDVSFGVEPGEVVSLIGESGSGKTTVGRMILRLTEATTGAITFDGRDVSGLGRRDLRRYYAHVQGVFQDPFSSYNPVFKVDRVLGMLRATYLPELSADEWKAKLRKSLEAVSLEPADVLGKYPHQLSGGQLQRLMIARALLLDLKFLVADEIISMLDASTRIDVLNLLGDLKERGVGILFITHDLSLGNYISDKTLILRRGRVVEMGATEKVYGKPAHPYTQMLLGSVPHLTDRWDAHVHTPVSEDGRRRRAARPDRRRPFCSHQRRDMSHHLHTDLPPLTLSFMGANYVGKELGYGAADEWGPFDVATNAAFEPIETFGAHFEELLTAIEAAGFDAMDLWMAHLNWRWATPEHVTVARDLLDRHGLRVVSLAGNFGDTVADLASACALANALDVDLLGGMGEVLRNDRPGAEVGAARARRPLRLREPPREDSRRGARPDR